MLKLDPEFTRYGSSLLVQLNITNMSTEVPQVDSVRDLHPLCEVFSFENGHQVFSRSTFALVTGDYRVYFGQAPIRKKALSPKDIKERLKHVPDEEVYPEAPSHITVVSIPINGNVYVKGPKLTIYDDVEGTGLLPKLLLQEAEILEILARRQHPNLIRYHGCIVERGRMVGLVLDRHPTTLECRLEDGAQSFNAKFCMNCIASAIEHLHSLGLAHNDLTPMNIMVDEYDAPIIVDFGSCRPFGEDLITAGTPGWVDEDFVTSEQRHDEIALRKIKTWLEEKTGSRL